MSRAFTCVVVLGVALLAGAARSQERSAGDVELKPGGPVGTEPAIYRIADPDAPIVTRDNLMASERFWPYQVELVRPWTPMGSERPIRAGGRGVLIRVESPEAARIDFGRHGQHLVPLGETDLLEGANRVRLGELRKLGPNFALAIGPRLVSEHGGRLLPVNFAATVKYAGFLCVFADPDAKEFPALAAALAPLRTQPGVMSMLFPQGDHTDAQVEAKLKELAWPVPFVIAHLRESYTKSLVPGDLALPAVTLQTNEGRLLLQRTWSAGVLAELTRALGDAFGAAAVASAPDALEAKP